jgi:uncharacterized protein
MTRGRMKAEVLLEGEARGPLLKLGAPLSFWGGVDPKTGTIIQVRHPQCGVNIAGTLLCLPATIGSSSSSAVLLELIRHGKAPAALILAAPDAILLIGCLVAREMGWPPPPAALVPVASQKRLAPGAYSLSREGVFTTLAS